jgi:DNA-binding transcriptional LysR family regulator
MVRVREDVMNLESKWLEDFSALAATRSFSQAAERRFVTQPAFSRRIRSLEAALGLTLVNRSRTPVELTAAGQLFLVTARTVVEQLGEVLRHLHHLEGGQGEVMQVAAAHSLALGFFPRWIAQLRNEGLNIATRLVATNVGDAVHALREGGSSRPCIWVTLKCSRCARRMPTANRCSTLKARPACRCWPTAPGLSSGVR